MTARWFREYESRCWYNRDGRSKFQQLRQISNFNSQLRQINLSHSYFLCFHQKFPRFISLVKLEPMLKIIWTTWSREKSGEQGVAGFPEILAKLVHDSFKEICFYDILIKLARAARGNFSSISLIFHEFFFRNSEQLVTN